MKQFTASEAIGQNFRMLYREEDQREGRPEKNIKSALERGRIHEQWWRRKKDGTLFWADAVMMPIYARNGDLIGLSKIVTACHPASLLPHATSDTFRYMS